MVECRIMKTIEESKTEKTQGVLYHIKNASFSLSPDVENQQLSIMIQTSTFPVVITCNFQEISRLINDLKECLTGMIEKI